jgi:hypothetical protein
MNEKKDRAALLKNFTDAALALMAEGLSGLTPERAALVDRAQRMGNDIVLAFAPAVGSVVVALHPADPDADPVELFKVFIPSSEVSN